MQSRYLPQIEKTKLEQALQPGNEQQFYELLVEPLHEELYRRQSFDFMDDLSEAQQLLLAYDYVRTQVGQGGFIQLLHNGYVGLLPPMPQALMIMGAPDMAELIDDALKAYVNNHEVLDKPTTPQEFATLYTSLPEFVPLDRRFEQLDQPTIAHILQYARNHQHEFLSEPGSS